MSTWSRMATRFCTCCLPWKYNVSANNTVIVHFGKWDIILSGATDQIYNAMNHTFPPSAKTRQIGVTYKYFFGAHFFPPPDKTRGMCSRVQIQRIVSNNCMMCRFLYALACARDVSPLARMNDGRMLGLRKIRSLLVLCPLWPSHFFSTSDIVCYRTVGPARSAT